MDFEALKDWYWPLRYVLPAYVLAILLIGGYARSISARRRVLEREREAFEAAESGRSGDDGSAVTSEG